MEIGKKKDTQKRWNTFFPTLKGTIETLKKIEKNRCLMMTRFVAIFERKKRVTKTTPNFRKSFIYFNRCCFFSCVKLEKKKKEQRMWQKNLLNKDQILFRKEGRDCLKREKGKANGRNVSAKRKEKIICKKIKCEKWCWHKKVIKRVLKYVLWLYKERLNFAQKRRAENVPKRVGCYNLKIKLKWQQKKILMHLLIALLPYDNLFQLLPP
jgi:hypothetical protein